MASAGLGESIRTMRTRKDLSLREAARQVGINPSYLCDIENGRRVPAEAVMEKIGALLDLDTWYLMALGGKLSNRADSYLRDNPLLINLVEEVSEAHLSGEQLEILAAQVRKWVKARPTNGKPRGLSRGQSPA